MKPSIIIAILILACVCFCHLILSMIQVWEVDILEDRVTKLEMIQECKL